MADFNKKKTSYGRFLHSPIFLIILLVIAIVLSKALWGVHEKEQISAGYLAKEQAELDRLVLRQKNLAQSVEYLKTDKGIEAEIRSKFRMVKEGESVAVILDNNNATASPELATTTPGSLSEGFWGSILNWFK